MASMPKRRAEMVYGKHLFVACLGVALVLACLPQAFAQTNYGGIVGTVTDATGAYIVGAKVSVTSDATNANRTSTSGSGGTYTVLNLNPGSYAVRVVSAGFKEYRRTQVEVTIGGTTRVDAGLSIGSVFDTVVVDGAATANLQTDTSSLGGVVEGRQVLESPLNGRNVNNLLNFIPGVVPGGGTSGSTIANGGSGNFQVGSQTQAIAYGNYQIGGGFSGQSLFFIDGVLSNVPENNVNSLVPTQDSVQEFRVLTNNPDVEFGGFGGGVVQISTKSGSNQYHGSGYEYFRNTVLDANDYFSNHQGLPRPPLHQNQFGGNLGGPLITNRLFGFFSFERETLSSGGISTYTVPTAAELSGDFSELGTNIYSPATGLQYTCNGRLNVLCNPDPTAVKILKLESPLPNRPGLINNYVATAPIVGAQNQFNARVDYNPGQSDQLFARYTFWNPHNGASDPLGTRTGSGPTGNTTTEAVVGENHIFNKSTIADLRVSYLQNYNFQVPLSEGFNLGDINANYGAIQAQQINDNSSGLLPSLDIQNYGVGAQLSQFYWLNTIYALSGSLTKVVHRHTIKAGGNFRGIRWTAFGVDGGVGLNALSTFTANATDPSSGNALAAFLAGVPSFVYVGEVNTSRAFLHSYGFYANDTYQMTSRLTLNLGIRWDEPGSYSEVNNNNTVLLPQLSTDLGSVINPITGVTQPVVGGLAFVASSQYPSRREEQLHSRLFAPRIGFAYRLDKSTVARGGYGIAYLPSEITADGPRGSAINSFFTVLTNTPGATYAGEPTVANPFPNGINAPLGRNPIGLTQLLGQGITSPIPSQPYGYVQQFNFGVEHLLDTRTSVSISYAGAKGTHLVMSQGFQSSGLNLNQLPDQYDSIGGDPIAQTGLFKNLANPFAGKFVSGGQLNQATIPEGYLLKPFPQYTTVEQTIPRYGASTYEALQASLTRRLGHGGMVQVAYTWAKLLSNTDNTSSFQDGQGGQGVVQDNYNLRAEKSVSLQDLTNNLVINYAVDLPFGRDRPFLNSGSPFLNAMVAGWQVNGITTIHSGLPVAFSTNGNDLSNYFGSGPIRPHVLSGCVRTSSGTAQSRSGAWFNTRDNAITGGKGCFYNPGPFEFGNEARVDSIVRSAAARNFDLAVNRSFPLVGDVTGKFSVEVFNLFNRAQFGPPNSDLDDPAFGTVTKQANLARTLQFALRVSF
ncbi:MAG: Cna domain protein [Acidobacteriaceae bacterium]|nr:Cna domain protein [Acidobacteriaceae bacterium]